MDKKERNIISTPQLEINENIMRYEDTITQMSNVTRCEIGTLPKEPYPTWAIIGALLGLFLLFNGTIKVGLCLLVVCCIVLGYIYWKNQGLGKYLIFELNSGHRLLFTCHSVSFLEDAQKAVIDCFNDRGTSYTVNFRNCEIKDSQIGKHNEVKVQR